MPYKSPSRVNFGSRVLAEIGDRLVAPLDFSDGQAGVELLTGAGWEFAVPRPTGNRSRSLQVSRVITIGDHHREPLLAQRIQSVRGTVADLDVTIPLAVSPGIDSQMRQRLPGAICTDATLTHLRQDLWEESFSFQATDVEIALRAPLLFVRDQGGSFEVQTRIPLSFPDADQASAMTLHAAHPASSGDEEPAFLPAVFPVFRTGADTEGGTFLSAFTLADPWDRSAHPTFDTSSVFFGNQYPDAYADLTIFADR